MSGTVAFDGPRPAPRTRSPQPPVSIWQVLGRRLFFWLTLASLISNIGTWMQNVGAAWLMTSLSPSPLMVALIQTASSLPIVLIALPAGALADITDRRRLLLFSQAWMLIAAGLLGALTIAHLTTPWSLLILSLALGIGGALNAPAWQAIIPELVERHELTSAVAVGGISFNAARAVGPALGGLVVAWAGAGVTFVLNAVSFLAVMAVLYEWRRPRSSSVMPAERILGAIRAGMRYTRHAPHLQSVLVRTAVFVFGGSALWAVLPLLAQQSLGLDAAGYGGLLACFGAGAMAAGALIPYLGQRFSRNAIAGGATAAFAAVSAAVALTRFLPLEFVMMAGLGAAWTLAMTTLNVAAQLSVPIWVQGRALAMYQVMVQGGIAGGSVLWGFVAERKSVPVALLAAALAIAASLLAMFRYKLASDSDLNLNPMAIPAPVTAGEIDPDSGPVLVTVEYLIDPQRAAKFTEAMRPVRALRLRDGAVFWGLFFDAAHKGRMMEYFVVESWMEHLRQHERGVGADADVFAVARAFHIAPHPPVTSHQVSTLHQGSLIKFEQSSTP